MRQTTDPAQSRLIIGCMTGTSLDGIDAALVGVVGRGLSMHARVLGLVSRPLGKCSEVLRAMAAGEAHAPIAYLQAARDLGHVHAEAAADLIRETGATKVDFLVAHGQTIWHAPADRDAYGRGLSWQIFDPWPVVSRLGLPVCYDLRQADLAAHGQGAPITPLADLILYRSLPRPSMVVNLGGVCNVTWLADHSPAGVTGGDIGPCNILLDTLVRRLYPGLGYDDGGRLASGGRVSDGFIAAAYENPFFVESKTGARRSTGREDFTDGWVGSLIERFASRGLTSADMLASGCEFIARFIVQYAKEKSGAGSLVIAGGGARNLHLVQRISTLAGEATRTVTSDQVGIGVEAREAAGFAVLGALSQDGVPITLPQVTGSRSPGVAGVWAGV